MLKFARHSRSSSVDRPSAVSRLRARSSSIERAPVIQKRGVERPPPPPLPLRSPTLPPKNCSDYEAISSLKMAPMTPTLQKMALNLNLAPKSALKKNLFSDFHRAVEKLVQEKYNSLDTSSESGYGSDQDQLHQQQLQGATASVAATPSIPPTIPPKKCRKQVKFDSYVMLLQGLRERDLEVIRGHLNQVSDAALLTDEVSSAFLTSIVENREDIVTALLARGFDANASADAAGLTGLHLAAAFNYLPIVRALLSYGACVFTLAHSSGKKAADLCSRNLPNFQACHAYLRCMEECLGVANQGRVYACHAYHTARTDELELVKGQLLKVLRKGDYPGSSWWWCQDNQGNQGYVLREILSLNNSVVLTSS